MPHIEAGEVQLEYLEQGTGDPVILIHGVLGDLRIWRNQTGAFSQTRRIISYSRRNHHPNTWSDYPSDYSLAVERDDLIALIRGLGLGRVHLVGNSLGATIGLLAARDYPGMFRSLVLNDPALRAFLADDPDNREAERRTDELVRSVREKVSQGRLEEATRAWTDFLMGHGSFDHLPPPAKMVLVQNVRPLPKELGAPPQSFTCEDAKRITMPTLLVGGDQTPPVFRRVKERLARCLPDCETASVPSASHAPYRQNPRVFNEAVLSFLGKH